MDITFLPTYKLQPGTVNMKPERIKQLEFRVIPTGFTQIIWTRY